MSFHEVQFPEDVSYGSGGGPRFSTSITETESGVEQRIARWNDPRYVFNVAYGIKTPTQLTTVRAFYIARKGPSSGFRYKDWQDFHSNSTNGGHDSAPGVRDQLIDVGTGSQTTFQLSKRYTSGPTSYNRRITKPRVGTVRAWVNSVELTAGSEFTVDTATGVFTCAVAPAAAHLVEASFQFDVPVRFADDDLLSRLDSFGTGSGESITLFEIVDTNSSNVSEFFYGGAQERAFGVNTSITTAARAWILAATAPNLSVSLPNPASIPPGGPVFYVMNSGAHSFILRDHLAASLATLAAGTGVEVTLSLTVGGSKVWYAA